MSDDKRQRHKILTDPEPGLASLHGAGVCPHQSFCQEPTCCHEQLLAPVRTPSPRGTALIAPCEVVFSCAALTIDGFQLGPAVRKVQDRA
jgi:hypothetical protein